MFGGGSASVTVGVAGGDADGSNDTPAEVRKRWYLIAGSTVSVVGFAAFLTTLDTGVREVLRTSGGFCASGGPYAIAHQCAPGETRQVFIGVIGMLIFGGLFAGLTALADGPIFAPAGLLWAALFGSLGYEFLFAPRASGSGGGDVTGILFLLMAAGGLVPVLMLAAGWIKRGGEPEPETPAFGGAPIVKAAAPAPIVNAPPAPPTAASTRPIVPSRLNLPKKDDF